MTSPTETSPTTTDNPLKAKAEEHVEVGGVRIPLPRWARFVIGIIAILGAGLPTVRYFYPTAQADPGKSSDAAVIQYREYVTHVSETPEFTQKLFESAELGSLVVNFYGSDGCLLVLKRAPGRFNQQIPYWIPKASIEAERPPGAQAASLGVLDSAPAAHAHVEAQIAPGVLALAGLTSPPAPVTCLNPHPGEFRWWNGEKKGCWQAVWRAWPDGCQHYQWFNACNGYWDSEPTGAPRVYWTNCAH